VRARVLRMFDRINTLAWLEGDMVQRIDLICQASVKRPFMNKNGP
jgi:hypothetical protein